MLNRAISNTLDKKLLTADEEAEIKQEEEAVKIEEEKLKRDLIEGLFFYYIFNYERRKGVIKI